MNYAEAVRKFCEIVRQRSVEHEVALKAMVELSILSQSVSIIRQEIDSLIRVRYVLSLSLSERKSVIENFLAGAFRGPNGKTKLLDKDMVAFAARIEGWPQVAYEFGCDFVHLSALHNFSPLDPLGGVDKAARTSIIDYLNRYHGDGLGPRPSAKELLLLAERVLDKITGNTEFYLELLTDNVLPENVV